MNQFLVKPERVFCWKTLRTGWLKRAIYTPIATMIFVQWDGETKETLCQEKDVDFPIKLENLTSSKGK